MDTDNDNSTYVRMEKYNDNDCQTTDSNTTCDFGCTVNGIYSHSFTIVSVTGDILKLGSDYDDNGNCDALYEESYMTDYCYVEDEKSNRLSRAGQLVYQTDYSDPSCSSFEEQRNYTLAECKEWQDGNHELFLLVAEGDLSSGETDGGVFNSINFVLLFTFLIVNSLFFLN
ncbi:hypothetical protein M0812_29567 [Anaeramoeba flamelloides]|uniref:Uncharacterized protein n=1 Tax=Anaeramoeba flamelloides TaxID=1746091 RepID=A0AAV7Y4J5_9EUKA|nr:hypothetical protein M0812_29567 [Anaeramoeba flamelloides]